MTKPIKPPRTGRLAGLAWTKNGVAIAATDVKWMAVRARSLEEAAILLESADDVGDLPPGKSAARVLRDLIGNVVRGTVTVDKATSKGDTLACKGVSFDPNLVLAALRSLGESTATLSVSGPYDAGVLHTATGLAIVTPLQPKT
jgi:hypothetical protein